MVSIATPWWEFWAVEMLIFIVVWAAASELASRPAERTAKSFVNFMGSPGGMVFCREDHRGQASFLPPEFYRRGSSGSVRIAHVMADSIRNP